MVVASPSNCFSPNQQPVLMLKQVRVALFAGAASLLLPQFYPIFCLFVCLFSFCIFVCLIAEAPSLLLHHLNQLTLQPSATLQSSEKWLICFKVNCGSLLDCQSGRPGCQQRLHLRTRQESHQALDCRSGPTKCRPWFHFCINPGNKITFSKYYTMIKKP